MEKHTPDRLWKSLCEALEKDEEPDNELLKTVYGVLKGTIVNEEISTVLDLIHNTRYREELIIFFLSGASCEDISRSLKIPPVQLEIFRKLIIDVTAFQHKLQFREFTREFKKQLQDPELVQLLEAGLLLGPDAIEYHFQHGKESVDFAHTELADKLLAVAF